MAAGIVYGLAAPHITGQGQTGQGRASLRFIRAELHADSHCCDPSHGRYTMIGVVLPQKSEGEGSASGQPVVFFRRGTSNVSWVDRDIGRDFSPRAGAVDFGRMGQEPHSVIQDAGARSNAPLGQEVACWIRYARRAASCTLASLGAASPALTMVSIRPGDRPSLESYAIDECRVERVCGGEPSRERRAKPRAQRMKPGGKYPKCSRRIAAGVNVSSHGAVSSSPRRGLLSRQGSGSSGIGRAPAGARLSARLRKLDPYLNVDPGPCRPISMGRFL